MYRCNMDFVLIDLLSQREAVKRYVQDWTKDSILEWITQFGEVRFWPRHSTYSFRSNADGRFYSFWVSDTGELQIIR
jgi:hypothetical protein